MEMTLSMGAFKEIEKRELHDVGGGNPLAWALGTVVAEALSYKFTGRGLGENLAYYSNSYGYDYARGTYHCK